MGATIEGREGLQLTERARKQQILDSAGYTYNFDREVYLNRKTKKVFSVDFLEDHTTDELQESIREATDSKKWTFYFNSQPVDAAKRELTMALG